MVGTQRGRGSEKAVRGKNALWAAFGLTGLVVLLVFVGGSISSSTTIDAGVFEVAPGSLPISQELAARLRSAHEAKGPDYVPRTERNIREVAHIGPAARVCRTTLALSSFVSDT